MRSHNRLGLILCCLLVLFIFTQTTSAQTYALSGRVYSGSSGTEPPVSTALSGITVELWGALTSGVKDYKITSTTTNTSGWYSVSVNVSVDAYDHYIIEEKDPSGYYSVDAKSVSGAKLTNNRIEYDFTDLSGTLTGNKFWDRPVRDLDVFGNSILIKNGSTTPRTGNGTDFGSTAVSGGSITKTFTIESTGSQTLTINNVVITGSHSADFTVTQLPASTVAGSGATTTFKIKFDPSGSGTRTAGVNIINNSITKNPYDFAIEGTGTVSSSPEINVQGENGLDITDGDLTLTVTDTDFGSVNVSSGAVVKSFTIQNNGTAALNLTGSSPYVSIDSTHASDFSVTSTPSSSIAAGNSTTFQITFDPSASGTRTATLSISNNDSNENPYNFAIEGVGTTGGGGTGTIIVEKRTIPAGESQQFTFTGDVAGSIGDGGQLIVTGLQPGTYTTTEVVPPGWTLSSLSVPMGSYASGPSSLTFNLTAGSTMKAEFWNAKDPEVDQYDFGDAGKSYNNYPNSLAQNGARHKIVPGFCLGTLIDAETDAQLDDFSRGDDKDNLDDEDGITLVWPWFAGHVDTIDVVASIPGGMSGYLDAWIDFDDDENWSASEQIFNSVPLTNGLNTLTFLHPIDFGGGAARFRLSSTGGLSPTGPTDDGEVEDYDAESGNLMDYGDAPAPYPTLRSQNGPSHWSWGKRFGYHVDPDTNGQPDANALGDDNTTAPGYQGFPAFDDEDGVTIPTLVIGQEDSITTVINITAYVDAWIDWNGDGIWQHPSEQIHSGQITVPGINDTVQIPVTPPAHSVPGTTYARFRISRNGGLLPTGYAGHDNDGEVEDYMVTIEDTTALYDFGDAPDPTYPTLLANDGARHKVVPGVFLGQDIDAEPDGQPNLKSTGDENNNLFDEDGVYLYRIVPGDPCSLHVHTSTNGFLNAWMDFNEDGDWTDQDEQILNDEAVSTGWNGIWINVPITTAAEDTIYCRFRFDTQGSLSFDGPADDGEVEDLMYYSSGLDFGDAPAPYPTLRADDGARHAGNSYIQMGTNIVDEELDGIPNATATGDDADNKDDEEGVTFNTSLIPGDSTSVDIFIFLLSPDHYTYLNAWIDFNRDGDWADPGEKIIAAEEVYVISYDQSTYKFKVPSDASPGTTYARFRISDDHQKDLSYVGIAYQGEVEDYMVTIEDASLGRDFGDAPTNLKYPSASHLLGGPWLGGYVGMNPSSAPYGDPDAETDMQSNIDADGDDTDGYDDEEALYFYSAAVSGVDWLFFAVDFAIPQGEWSTTGIWVDWNRDGDWDDAEEHVGTKSDNWYSVWWQRGVIPSKISHINPGPSYVRIRTVKGKNVSLTPSGDMGPGEVEDHAIVIPQPGGPTPQGGQIIGYKWNDLNGDGIWQKGEPGLPAWTIFLDLNGNGLQDPGEPAQTTGSDGSYLFSGLSAGSYDVYEKDQHPQWTPTYPSVTPGMYLGHTVDPTSATFSALNFGNHNSSLESDFGDAPLPYPSASHLVGDVYFGTPTSGMPDSESGMQRTPPGLGDDQDGNDDEEHVTITLNPFGTHLYEWKVDFTGFGLDYCVLEGWIDWNGDGVWDPILDTVKGFGGLIGAHPGTFGLYDYIPSYAVADTTYARFRIVKNTTGMSDIKPYGDYGIGEVCDLKIEIPEDGGPPPETGMIPGYKWYDSDGDGVWNSGELPMSGWQIWLDANQNGIEDIGDQYTTTDASGQFIFSGLNAGTYLVGETLQTGWTQTYPGGAGTHSVTVNTTGPFQSIFFGNKQEGSLELDAVKWAQPPLLEEPVEPDTVYYLGVREASVSGMPMAADDWFCYNPEPITAIRWWGTYADWDSTVAPDNAPDQFHIGIWTDVPKDVDGPFSHPGILVEEWTLNRSIMYERTDRCVRHPDPQEPPVTGFEYTYSIPTSDWFYQEGDSTIYWLSITALYDEEAQEHEWGWLAREHYFHDDAVRMEFTNMPDSGSTYESGEPIAPRWDLSFVLGTEEFETSFDFGDAPENDYATLLVDNGALHRITTGVYMGESVDEDDDGQPDNNARGDDDDEEDDEDGVQLTETLVSGQDNDAIVTVSSHGFLNAWLDIDGDGNWYESDDYVLEDIELSAGEHTVPFFLSEDAEDGQTAFRFRFSTEPGLWFNGFAIDGEVEDYWVTVQSGSDVSDDPSDFPTEFRLEANYPNPFNPETKITYALPVRSRITLDVYNIQGDWIKSLISGVQEPGVHLVMWDGTNRQGARVSSGLYLCVMKTQEYVKTIRMLLLK